MDSRSHSHSRYHLVLGLLIVLIGIVALLDNLDVINAWDVFQFWPVIFIILGYFKIRDAMTVMGRLIGLFFVGIGVLLLLDHFYYIHFYFWDWWPVLLILIGAGLLMNRTSIRGREPGGTTSQPRLTDSDAVVSLFAFMSGFKRLCNSQEFRGGELTAIMGGCEIDLRQAVMKDSSATITIFAFWGGITILVPKEWSISVQAIPILGGVGDKTTPVQSDQRKLLIIHGQVIMGGAEISN